MSSTLIHTSPIHTPATRAGYDRTGSDVTEPVVATAHDLAHTIGRRHVRTIEPHHVALAVTVAELARSAGSRLEWSPDDPTVVLLRALSNLAVDAPDAVSREGASLLAALG